MESLFDLEGLLFVFKGCTYISATYPGLCQICFFLFISFRIKISA